MFKVSVGTFSPPPPPPPPPAKAEWCPKLTHSHNAQSSTHQCYVLYNKHRANFAHVCFLLAYKDHSKLSDHAPSTHLHTN